MGGGGTWKEGVLLFCGCIQVASGPQPECWPTSLTLFFTGHNEIGMNSNSIWVNHVRANEQNQTDFECKSKMPFYYSKSELSWKEWAIFYFLIHPKKSGNQEMIFLSSSWPRKMPEALSECRHSESPVSLRFSNSNTDEKNRFLSL